MRMPKLDSLMTPYSHASDRWLYAACGEGGHVLQW